MILISVFTTLNTISLLNLTGNKVLLFFLKTKTNILKLTPVYKCLLRSKFFNMLRQELSSKINTAYEVPSPFKTNIINAKLFWMIEISCLFIRSSRFGVPAITKKYYVTVWKYFICTYISSQCCLNASINFLSKSFKTFKV